MQIKYQKVKEEILKRLGTGEWKPGDRISAERILADEFGVSRITAKRAVTDLIHSGHLTRHTGRRGTFVKVPVAEPPSRLIAVAIDDVRDRFGAQVLRGIEDFLWDRRFHTLICNGDRNFEKVNDYFHSLIAHNVAGVIFCPVIDEGYVANNREILGFLTVNRLPCVLIDRFVPGVLSNYIGANHRESSRLITEHLIAAGHSRIAIAVGIECTSMTDRLQGYTDALGNAGIPVDERLIIRCNDNRLYRRPEEAEVEHMREQIKRCGEFTSFYGLNSRLLESGVRILLEEGLEPGSKIYISSHDKPPAGIPVDMAHIPYVEQPEYQMGWEAGQTLLDHIEDSNAPVVQKILNSKFVYPHDSLVK